MRYVYKILVIVVNIHVLVDQGEIMADTRAEEKKY